MGYKENSAQWVSDTLEDAGVPRVIAHMIGQCAYIPQRRRHPDIPTPIVRGSKIDSLVDDYVEQLKTTSDPVVKAAFVQGLCRRVFEPADAEEIFVAGYPEFSPEAFAEYAKEAEAEGLANTRPSAQADREKILIAAGRYFTAGYDPTAPDDAQVVAYLEQKGDPIGGFLVTMRDSLSFYDPHDLSAENADGNPLILKISEITGGEVSKPSTLVLDKYSRLRVEPSTEDFVRLVVTTDSGGVRCLISLGNDDEDLRLEVQTELRRLLYVVDRGILHHEAEKQS